MLTREQIEERLAGWDPFREEIGRDSPTEREALETAKQLAEWGAMSLMDCHDCPEAHGEISCDHKMPYYPCFVAKYRFEAWLEGSDV